MGVEQKTWTIDDVDNELRQAARTAHRLPPVRVTGYVSRWPVIIRTDGEKVTVEEQKPFRIPPSPKDVDQMLEAMRWMHWLDVEQRHLLWMRAERHRWSEIAKRFACCSRTAQRRCDAAMHLISLYLNKEKK